MNLSEYRALFEEHPELRESIRGRRLAQKRSEKKSITDELTSLYNFRHFQNSLELEFQRTMRFSHSLSLILGDIDHFKKYNDDYGHEEGNKFLRQLGYTIRTHIRKIDTAYRYGGEEFAIILPETDSSGAKKVADVLRGHIEKIEAKKNVTMSFGIGTYPHKDIMNPIGLFNNADSALYLAKNTGRNKICTYEDLKKL